jgi:hypothetical protein
VHGFAFIAQHSFGILTTEDRSRAGIDGSSAILFETVMDLAFVSIHVFARNASKENPRVNVFGKR